MSNRNKNKPQLWEVINCYTGEVYKYRIIYPNGHCEFILNYHRNDWYTSCFILNKKYNKSMTLKLMKEYDKNSNTKSKFVRNL